MQVFPALESFIMRINHSVSSPRQHPTQLRILDLPTDSALQMRRSFAKSNL